MAAFVPTVFPLSGAQPTPPSVILANLLASVAAVNPGYTATLPGSLIEDVSSTDVAAIAMSDQAVVELINSLTPFGANAFILSQLGVQVYGVPIGQPTNTSVLVVFTTSPPAPGFVIGEGFTVSDGTYQYTAVDGGVIGSDGNSIPLFCLATIPGSWAVPPGTVSQLITSVPSPINLSVTNPEAGVPGLATGESESDYRARVLQAGYANSTGGPSLLKTALGKISGVQQRLISVRQNGTAWEVICGGGDPYQVAYAIYNALFYIPGLVGSTLAVTGITNASPGVVTTDLNHGFTTGQVINIAGVVGMSGVNNTPLTIIVIDETNFSIGIDTTSSGAYVSGGVVTPNLRNIVVSIQDYPDVYQIPYVNPPQQTVAITVTWNTTATNFVSAAAVAQLGTPALVNYVNGLAVGVPINLFELQAFFQQAIASVLPPQLLTRMVFDVSINGIGVSPEVGTGIIAGDPESYFLIDATEVTINQG